MTSNPSNRISNRKKDIFIDMIGYWIPIFASFLSLIFLSYKAFELRIFFGISSPDFSTFNSLRILRLSFFIYLLAAIFCLISLLGVIARRYIIQKNKGLISRINWTIERLAQLEINTKEKQKIDVNPESHWPWGSHHTTALGDLEAAAHRFWTLYEPNDPSTAPTNEMVAGWLRTERGVSKEKATAIASILRADGLRPGPRR